MADAIGRNEAATLGVAVNTDASKDPADGVDRLLGCVRVDGRDPAVCRTAIVGLERFFSERLCRGDLRVSLDPRDAKGASRKERLGEQYKTFTRRLCAVLADEVVEDGDAGGAKDRRARTEDDGAAAAVPSVSPRTQVLALRAVMELARSEHPGKLNNELYERALRAAVTGTAFSPELLGALTGRYLPCHDVRHHTYAAVGRMADEFRKSSSASASKRKRDDDDAGALEREQDTARNLYDVLNGCPPDFTDYAGTGASPRPGVDDQKSQNKAKKPNDDDDGDGEDFEAMLGLMKSGDGGADSGADGRVPMDRVPTRSTRRTRTARGARAFPSANARRFTTRPIKKKTASVSPRRGGNGRSQPPRRRRTRAESRLTSRRISGRTGRSVGSCFRRLGSRFSEARFPMTFTGRF